MSWKQQKLEKTLEKSVCYDYWDFLTYFLTTTIWRRTKFQLKMFENNSISLCYSTNSSRSKQTTRMLFWYRWQKIRPPRIHDFFSPVNFVFDSGIAMSLWKMDRKLASIPLEKFCVIVASRHRKVGLDFWLKIGALCLGQWVTIVSQKASILIFMHFNL